MGALPKMNFIIVLGPVFGGRTPGGGQLEQQVFG